MIEDYISFTENIFGKIDNIDEVKIKTLNRSRKTQSWDTHDNYELLELYGDKILQSQFCHYLMTRYKIGEHENAVNIITRLIIKFLSGESLTVLCINIGLSCFILDKDNPNKYGVEEDIFEAWIGACHFIYDAEKFSAGLFRLFDTFKISFNFQELYDPRSILNDFSSAKNMKMKNKGTIIEGNEFINTTTIEEDTKNIRKNSRWDRNSKMIGIGRAKTKKLAEQESACKILDNYISNSGVQNFFEILKTTKTYQKWEKFYLSYNKISVKQ